MLLHGVLNKKTTKIPPECRVSTTARVLLIALIAIISRLFCIIYTIIWNKLINNYKFSNNILCYGDKGGETLWQYIKCFSYWDGEYFLRLSLNETEYLYEQNHAFFPSLPLIIIYTKNLLKRFLLNMNECEMHVLIALVINNLFFVCATIGVYVFPLVHFKNRKNAYYDEEEEEQQTLQRQKQRQQQRQKQQHGYALPSTSEQNCFYLRNVKDKEEYNRFSFFLSILYTFSIGNIHVSSFYNESIFSCFSIWGFNFLQLSVSWYKMNIVFEILAVISFFIASCFRSNGILFLIPLFFFNIHTCKFFEYIISTQFCISKEKKRKHKITIISYFSTKRHIFSFIIHWLKALIEAIVIVSPFIIFQFYSYQLYCVQQEHNDLWNEQNIKFSSFLNNFRKNFFNNFNIWNNKKNILINRPWCNKKLPFVYNYIQYKYWNVKFLKIFKSPNFNILYSAPIFFISFHCVHNFFRYNKFIPSNILVFFHPFFGSIIHLCILSLYILIFAHNEIILRLIISSPMFYLHYAYLLKYFEKWNYLFFVNLMFFFVGPPLFGTYIGWT
ncbi:GPI mannosyltransferase 2, putative [Plasmodium malariae]|uniref:GPI mannosyltransferase 2 n=1 Tax=Plasmodium malariae TaxID=5858 RepID=A0A1C3L3L0_PLAMA|nr:GPI mannosyltransferase 2, putative [Plasmodium malariae]